MGPKSAAGRVMSVLRRSRPGHVTEFVDLGPSKATVSRSGIRGGSGVVFGALAVGESRYSGAIEKRKGAHSPKYRPGVSRFGDDSVMKNPDNGGVQAPITEVQR